MSGCAVTKADRSLRSTGINFRLTFPLELTPFFTSWAKELLISGAEIYTFRNSLPKKPVKCLDVTVFFFCVQKFFKQFFCNMKKVKIKT